MHNLPLNCVKPFEMCGKQCVTFRGRSGAVHVLSAYCSHLSANLGVGGHVVTESESGDDCIQCPFHGWRFGGKESELNTVKAVVKKWQTIEKNEVIYVWHHSEDSVPNHNLQDFLGNNYRSSFRPIAIHKCITNTNNKPVSGHALPPNCKYRYEYFGCNEWLAGKDLMDTHFRLPSLCKRRSLLTTHLTPIMTKAKTRTLGRRQ
ncbi:unnamed protein product [Medioppia subpectinata]|uniref:Rieske domain-containing protein n=1 Tax=Medioppia subpectinata TaxID=1979941 RepID=A0A7R9KCZ0_9ACAR|nr:unnamed protein product [Medioppia subpectinata]CAG2100821.1 unnamed protein product [Medioppia subpectinata]